MRTLEVHALGLLWAVRIGNGMQITFTHQHVCLGVDFYFVAVFWVIQDGVFEFDLTHRWPDGDYLSPGESFAHSRGGRNDDARCRATFGGTLIRFHQNSIVQHTNRELSL